MSCSLCRLPFTPDFKSVSPHPPPQGILTDKQSLYFTKAVGIGEKVPFNMLKCDFLDEGMFGTFKGFVLNIQWKSSGGTLMMFHNICSNILRHIFNCHESSLKCVIDLCEIERVLGRPKDVPDEGRLPHVRYEEAGPEKVDVRRYYRREEEYMRLDWQRFKDDGYAWTLSRPDIFPRFHSKVADSRFPGPPPEKTKDILTTLPLDVLHTLLPYLSDRSFILLLSTCRTLRHHGLTTFQYQARQRAIDLGWAIPLPREYASVPELTRQKGAMVNPADPPLHGDWLLYLGSVCKTPSMRARRWIWATAQELRRAYLEQKAGGPYEDIVTGEGDGAKVVKGPEREKLEKAIETNPFRMLGTYDW